MKRLGIYKTKTTIIFLNINLHVLDSIKICEQLHNL